MELERRVVAVPWMPNRHRTMMMPSLKAKFAITNKGEEIKLSVIKSQLNNEEVLKV
jgi:hypothetical protein